MSKLNLKGPPPQSVTFVMGADINDQFLYATRSINKFLLLAATARIAACHGSFDRIRHSPGGAQMHRHLIRGCLGPATPVCLLQTASRSVQSFLQLFARLIRVTLCSFTPDAVHCVVLRYRTAPHPVQTNLEETSETKK